MRDQGSPPLDSPPRSGYNIGRKGAATSGWPDQESNSMARNRHRAGWRFLRFTTMVTVSGPMCNVIRMSLTPSRVVWPTACRLCSARQYLTTSDGLWQAPGLTAADRTGIIPVERALRQAVGPTKSQNSQSTAMRPSLGRVAVSAFYDDRHGKPSDMYRKPHRRHPLPGGVANRLPFVQRLLHFIMVRQKTQAIAKSGPLQPERAAVCFGGKVSGPSPGPSGPW